MYRQFWVEVGEVFDFSGNGKAEKGEKQVLRKRLDTTEKVEAAMIAPLVLARYIPSFLPTTKTFH